MELLRNEWGNDLQSIRPRLKNIFYKGKISLLVDESPKLAIVGSRRMTDYGLRVIEKWMPVFVDKGITIVSGFMYGVDQAAHKACLENGGKTIAVLGWGIDNRIGGGDRSLYQRILEVDSLILSEWKEMEADRSTFPQRNRIVAGISDAVLVVEGANKSGSLITARLAGQYGKKLMAVPGQVTSRIAEGTNELIKSRKAIMVTKAEEVLGVMGLGAGQMDLLNVRVTDPVMNLLADGPRSVDEIAVLLKMSLPETLKKLTELSLRDLVIERAGKFCLV